MEKAANAAGNLHLTLCVVFLDDNRWIEKADYVCAATGRGSFSILYKCHFIYVAFFMCSSSHTHTHKLTVLIISSIISTTVVIHSY